MFALHLIDMLGEDYPSQKHQKQSEQEGTQYF